MKRLSLRAKLLLFLLLVNVLATVAFTVNTYRSDRRNLLEGIDQKLLSCASAVALLLPPDYHDRIDSDTSIPQEEYWTYLQRLSDYAARLGVTYVYAYEQIDGVIRTTATNATADELADGSYTGFFEAYTTPSTGMLEAFATGEVRYDEYTDEFGHFRSVFLPQQTPAGRHYLVGADIAIDFIQRHLHATLLRCVSIGLGIFLAVLLVSWLFIYRVSGPLIRLSAYTQHLAARKFAPDPGQQAELAVIQQRSHDEVGRLAASFLTMEGKLGEYLADLTRTTAAKERIESELKIARDIQRSILAQSFDLGPGSRAEVYAAMEPAKEVGGDLFDFFRIDDRRLAVLVGDVSDKGVPAAFFMAVSVTLLRAHGSKDLTPAEVLALVNNELCRQNESMMFVTVFLGVLDLETGRLQYSNGGHNPPLLLRSGGEVETLPPTSGAALGVFEETSFTNAEVTLAPGDVALLYTDGVTEAMNDAKHLFSLERLRELATRTPDRGARSIVEAVTRDVAAFADGCPQSDDITLLAVRRA